MKQVKFCDVKIGDKFRDTFYSGDWCIKTSDDTARPITFSSPMVYGMSPKSAVEIDEQPKGRS